MIDSNEEEEEEEEEWYDTTVEENEISTYCNNMNSSFISTPFSSQLPASTFTSQAILLSSSQNAFIGRSVSQDRGCKWRQVESCEQISSDSDSDRTFALVEVINSVTQVLRRDETERETQMWKRLKMKLTEKREKQKKKKTVRKMKKNARWEHFQLALTAIVKRDS